MKYITYQSTDNIYGAISAFKKKIYSDMENITTILMFVSVIYEQPEELCGAMNAAFPNTKVYGINVPYELCPSNKQDGEFVTEGSIVFIALTNEIIEDIHGEIVPSNMFAIDENVEKAKESFEQYFGKPLEKLEQDKYFCVQLMDSGWGAIEILADVWSVKLQLCSIGGLGGKLFEEGTVEIYANGKYYNNASLTLIMKSAIPFHLEKSEPFDLTEHSAIATEVKMYDFPTLLGLDNKPAIEVYENFINRDNLNIYNEEELRKIFIKNPLGKIINGEIYIKSMMPIIYDKKGLYTGIRIEQGERVFICKLKNIVENGLTTKKNIKDKYGNNISFILAFTCINNWWELSLNNKISEWIGNINSELVGCFVNGEIYKGKLVNMTTSMLIFE